METKKAKSLLNKKFNSNISLTVLLLTLAGFVLFFFLVSGSMTENRFGTHMMWNANMNSSPLWYMLTISYISATFVIGSFILLSLTFRKRIHLNDGQEKIIRIASFLIIGVAGFIIGLSAITFAAFQSQFVISQFTDHINFGGKLNYADQGVWIGSISIGLIVLVLSFMVYFLVTKKEVSNKLYFVLRNTSIAFVAMGWLVFNLNVSAFGAMGGDANILISGITSGKIDIDDLIDNTVIDLNTLDAINGWLAPLNIGVNDLVVWLEKTQKNLVAIFKSIQNDIQHVHSSIVEWFNKISSQNTFSKIWTGNGNEFIGLYSIITYVNVHSNIIPNEIMKFLDSQGIGLTLPIVKGITNDILFVANWVFTNDSFVNSKLDKWLFNGIQRFWNNSDLALNFRSLINDIQGMILNLQYSISHLLLNFNNIVTSFISKLKTIDQNIANMIPLFTILTSLLDPIKNFLTHIGSFDKPGIIYGVNNSFNSYLIFSLLLTITALLPVYGTYTYYKYDDNSKSILYDASIYIILIVTAIYIFLAWITPYIPHESGIPYDSTFSVSINDKLKLKLPIPDELITISNALSGKYNSIAPGLIAIPGQQGGILSAIVYYMPDYKGTVTWWITFVMIVLTPFVGLLGSLFKNHIIPSVPFKETFGKVKDYDYAKKLETIKKSHTKAK